MCGICGIYNPVDKFPDRSLISKMSAETLVVQSSMTARAARLCFIRLLLLMQIFILLLSLFALIMCCAHATLTRSVAGESRDELNT